MLRLSFALITLFSNATGAAAETIDVKYYGKLDLAPFICTEFTRSQSSEPLSFRDFIVVVLRLCNGWQRKGALSELVPVVTIAAFESSTIGTRPHSSICRSFCSSSATTAPEQYSLWMFVRAGPIT
jgi:hypothetical protein